MANRDIVVIGTSAGGIEALQQLFGALPAGLGAAVLVVLHTSNHAGSMLPEILGRASKLPVLHPKDGAPIEKGHIYIAAPDTHMIVERDAIRVIKGLRENRHRPAIDPLFRSTAAAFGRRVIGVILTGSLDDGTAGLMVVHARGGETIVQDPATAMFASMPRSASEQVPAAHVLPLPEIPTVIVRLVGEELKDLEPAGHTAADKATKETRISELDMSEIEDEHRIGLPSAFACPDCGGVLWEVDDHGFLRFRCRVGHAFTARHLGAEQRHAIETALWSALRALEESASLYGRMAERASNAKHKSASEKFKERADNTHQNARTLRDYLLRVNANSEEDFGVREG